MAFLEERAGSPCVCATERPYDFIRHMDDEIIRHKDLKSSKGKRKKEKAMRAQEHVGASVKEKDMDNNFIASSLALYPRCHQTIQLIPTRTRIQPKREKPPRD